MIEKMNKWMRENKDVLCVFLCMLFIFSYIMFVVKWASDLCYHAWIAQQMLEEHRLFNGNFLMYFLTNLLTLFTGYKYPMRAALVLLITLSNTAKYIIVREAFKEWISEKFAKLSAISLLFVYIIPILTCISGVCSSLYIPDTGWYLGYYVPNVWHNSTVLCMMPFAIACYLLSVKQFEEYSSKRNWLITILLCLSVLIKPSFFFIYLVAYPIIILSKYGLNKVFFSSLIPLVSGALCLAYEYIMIYYNGGGDGSGVEIDIMQLFTLDFWKPRALYLLVSLVLPLLFLCLYIRRIYQDREFWFVIIMLACALGISWCCIETGPRADHGNFYWQVIVAMWFVYFYILKTIVRVTNGESAVNVKRMIMLGVYGLHVLFGLVYLTRFMVTRCYF